MTETTIFTFHIYSLFNKWVNKFDLDEAPARKAKNIKVIFRKVSKDNLHKAMVLVQAEKGVIGKHLRKNFDNFKKNGAYMSAAVPSNWLI